MLRRDFKHGVIASVAVVEIARRIPGFHAGAYIRAYVEERLNSFHKVETLIAALLAFREGLSAEAALHRRRERQLAGSD